MRPLPLAAGVLAVAAAAQAAALNDEHNNAFVKASRNCFILIYTARCIFDLRFESLPVQCLLVYIRFALFIAPVLVLRVFNDWARSGHHRLCLTPFLLCSLSLRQNSIVETS